MSDPLINPNPLPPITLTSLSDHIVEIDDRISLVNRKLEVAQRDVIVIAVGITIVIFAFLGIGYFVYDNARSIADLSAKQTSGEIQRANMDETQRNGMCIAVEAWRGTYSSAGRNAYPGGTGLYDELYRQLTQASKILKCGPA